MLQTVADLAVEPDAVGKPLIGRLTGTWAARVGNYRVLSTLLKGRKQASGLPFVRYDIGRLLTGPDGDAVNRSSDRDLFPDDRDSVVRVTETTAHHLLISNS